MKHLIICSFLITIFIGGCTTKQKNNPLTTNLPLGKIFLDINKSNAPSSVVNVKAILTRDGFDSMTGFLNLLSDSTAGIQIDNIPAGTWSLVVNAVDSSNIVLFSGEAEVNILAGFVTQISLVLNPTGEGSGSIHIYVTWNTGHNVWADFELNPILESSGVFWDSAFVAESKVLFEDNIFKMYYLSLSNNGNSYVNYAESNDGISWTKPFSHPVLYPGSPGTWDSWAVQAGYILKEDNSYKMYFTGWSDNYGNWNIGLATSVDGIIWEKRTNPVLYSSVGWEYQIHVSSVIKFNGTYFLYYTGRNLPDLKIGVATSTDGVNWTKYSGNPILTSTKLWEGNGIYYPSVVIENSEFKMVYMNSTGSGFGFAYSMDGLNWEKDNSNPFFSRDNTSNDWANTKIAYPNLIKLPSEQRIYYSGQNNGESLKIGFMRKY